MTTQDRMNMIDKFTEAYLDAALWSSTDDNDEPLDANYDLLSFSDETLLKMVDDCKKFRHESGNYVNRTAHDLSQAGHDFWLTRNGHGAGFWDGDWADDAGTNDGRTVGEVLTEMAKKYREVDLYVGDDGKIYC